MGKAIVKILGGITVIALYVGVFLGMSALAFLFTIDLLLRIFG